MNHYVADYSDRGFHRTIKFYKERMMILNKRDKYGYDKTNEVVSRNYFLRK